MFFIEVILPIPLKQTFTYSVNRDEALFLKQGMRVAVPFGKSKIQTGIVFEVHQTPPPGYETKPIDQILDEFQLVTPLQITHWKWLASYYMCTLGEVVRAALPSAFLLESETQIRLRKDGNTDESQLSDDEFLVVEALQHQSAIHLNDIRSILDRKHVVVLIDRLISKSFVEVEEEVVEKYKPKIRRFIKLAPAYRQEANLRELLDSMTRAPKQRQLLMTLFMLSTTEDQVDAVDLQKRSGANASVLRSLIDKGILEEYHIQKDRYEYSGAEKEAAKSLSEAQLKALEAVHRSFSQQDITLLHGVTSSGKTEIYVRLIQSFIDQGKQVLYMLPEIALTAQLIARLQRYFGSQIAIYHSKTSLNERVEVWHQVLEQKAKAQIVIGTRSSLFLPFKNLGLIVIDEEHEPSYKQHRPAPRYHARDAAMKLAADHKAKVLMGSATPSLETFHNVETGKYGLVSLTERYGNVVMPQIELVDIRDQYKRKRMTGHFSEMLLTGIRDALEHHEQVILFQNRRGYAPVVECTTCGTVPQCQNCDVSLTYHKHKNELRCHYCGYRMGMPVSCMACGMETLDHKGFGTEQIESELKILFPDNRIARMDQDTTRAKHAYPKLIERMENHEIDILVGTQMLAKGLDFRNVSLVGVMNADQLLNFPDFRSHERSFQLLQQVAGRSGRTAKQGRVIIQTYNPMHSILQQVVNYDYRGMFDTQLEDRLQYQYPPHFRTIRLSFRHRNYKLMNQASLWFGQVLRSQLGDTVLGPAPPPVGRIRNEYIAHILVKIAKTQSLAKVKSLITQVRQKFMATSEFGRVKLIIDVDHY